MCAAFPRADYYGGSAPRPRRGRTCRSAGLRGPGARIEVPMFTGETFDAVGGRLCPWQRGPLAESGLGVGVPMAGTLSHAENSDQALAASPTRGWVLTPYRGFQHRLHLLHLGTFGSPPREPLLPCGQFRPLGCCRSPVQSQRRSRSPSAPGPTRARMTFSVHRFLLRLMAHLLLLVTRTRILLLTRVRRRRRS